MGSDTKTTTTDNQPWIKAQPYLEDIMSGGQAAYKSGAGSQIWQGPTLAAQSAETQTGLGSMADTARAMQPYAGMPAMAANSIIANGGLSSAMQPGLTTLGGMAQGDTNVGSYLGGMGENGSTNPWLQQQLDDNAQRIGNRVASQMSGAGRLGSFGYGDAMARSITAANAPILSAAYESDQGRRLAASQAADQTQMGAAQSQLGYLGQGLDRVGNFAGMMPALNDLQYDPSKRLLAVGQVNDDRAQQQLDADRLKFEQTQNLPWTQLGKYQNAISGLGGILNNTGTSTTTSTQESNPLSSILGILSLGVGAFRSDRRVKKDIVQVGVLPNGLNVYEFTFIEGGPRHVGLMAQEVMHVHPDAVHDIDGVLHVDYSKAVR